MRSGCSKKDKKPFLEIGTGLYIYLIAPSVTGPCILYEARADESGCQKLILMRLSLRIPRVPGRPSTADKSLGCCISLRGTKSTGETGWVS